MQTFLLFLLITHSVIMTSELSLHNFRLPKYNPYLNVRYYEIMMIKILNILYFRTVRKFYNKVVDKMVKKFPSTNETLEQMDFSIPKMKETLPQDSGILFLHYIKTYNIPDNTFHKVR